MYSGVLCYLKQQELLYDSFVLHIQIVHLFSLSMYY